MSDHQKHVIADHGGTEECNETQINRLIELKFVKRCPGCSDATVNVYHIDEASSWRDVMCAMTTN